MFHGDHQIQHSAVGLAGKAVEPVVAQIHTEGVRPLPAVNRTATLHPIAPPPQILPVVVSQDDFDGNGLFDLAKIQPSIHDCRPLPWATAASSPASTSEPSTIRRAIAVRHSFTRLCNVRSWPGSKDIDNSV